jgi:hypothetical protein
MFHCEMKYSVSFLILNIDEFLDLVFPCIHCFIYYLSLLLGERLQIPEKCRHPSCVVPIRGANAIGSDMSYLIDCRYSLNLVRFINRSLERKRIQVFL